MPPQRQPSPRGNNLKKMDTNMGFSGRNNPLIPTLAPVPWNMVASRNAMGSDEELINRMTEDLEKFQCESPSAVEKLPPNIPPDRQLPDRHALLMDRDLEIIPLPRPYNNLVDENQRLYNFLDGQRRKLMKRKVLCAFMFGALRVQADRVDQLRARTQGKAEECAARIILHNMLIHVYRKGQDQLRHFSDENKQLEKHVENLCLQLRVVRHLQSAEKERTLEKSHEITSLTSEVNYVKKQLSKAKSELERIEKVCEASQLGNEKISEEKTKLQRELRCVEDRKDILQGSLDLERKRSEKQMTEIRGLKRTVSDLQLQIAELTTQTDNWQEKARNFESKNWELQLLLESRGKEFTELGRSRDVLKARCDDIKEENEKLSKRNLELEGELKENHMETRKLKKALSVTEAQLEQQLGRIGQLENAVINIQRESSIMKSELMNHKLKNLRRRRAWATFALMISTPFESIINFIYGDSSLAHVSGPFVK